MIAARTLLRTLVLPLVLAASYASLPAQTITAPFAQDYTYRSLGQPPGVPCPYGGVTIDPNDPSRMLIVSRPNEPDTEVYSIQVTRDARGHITGFLGQAQLLFQSFHADSALEWAPGDVLFICRYPWNEIAQYKPGSVTPDRIDLLVGRRSIGAVAIVPPTHPGAGRLKSIRWPEGHWYDAQIQPDGSGTFDILNEQRIVDLDFHPSSMDYVPLNSPRLTGRHCIVTEYWHGQIAIYDVDGNGDAIRSSRQLLMTGVRLPVAIQFDPTTSDALVTTYRWCENDEVLLIQGFGSCSCYTNYGTGLAGTGGVIPTINGSPCPRQGRTTQFVLDNGQPFAPGGLLLGTQQFAVPYLGGTLLNNVFLMVPLLLDGTGRLNVSTVLPQLPPGAPTIDFYLQAVYADAGCTYGFSFTDGLQLSIK